MGCDKCIGCAPQRIVVGERLRIGHVEASTGDVSVVQRRGKRGLIKKTTASDIDQKRTGSHCLQFRTGNDVTCSRRESAAQEHDSRLRQQIMNMAERLDVATVRVAAWGDCARTFSVSLAGDALPPRTFSTLSVNSGHRTALRRGEQKTHLPIPIEDQVEVASPVGDILHGPVTATVVHATAVRDGKIAWLWPVNVGCFANRRSCACASTTLVPSDGTIWRWPRHAAGTTVRNSRCRKSRGGRRCRRSA